MAERFSYFAPAYLIKGGATGKTVKVGGCISTEKVDSQGEKVLSKGLDFSYFTGGWGKIKFEHDTSTPDNYIGVPTRIFKKSGEIHFEGELYPFDGVADDKLTPQQKMAKSAYGLLIMTEEMNRRNPENPQKVGWSIEGEYLDRDKKTGLVRKARVVNVVLTTKPVNTTTYAMLVKSLEVGHGTSPETQTGFGAIRKESLDGVKNVSSKKETTKMVFQNKEDVYKALIEKGVDEESAGKEADKWEAEQEKKRKAAKPEPKPEAAGAEPMPGEPDGDEMPDEKEPAMKSLQMANEMLKKSIEFVSKANSVEVSPLDIEEYDRRMNKALDLNQEDNSIDVANYLIGKHEIDKGMIEGQDGLAAKISHLGNAQALLAKSLMFQNDFVRKSISEIENLTKAAVKGVTALVKSRSNDMGTLVTDRTILNQYNYDNSSTDEAPLTKSEKVQILDKLADQGTIKGDVVMRFESSGYLDPVFEEMVKSNKNLLRK